MTAKNRGDLQIGREELFGSRDLRHPPRTSRVLLPSDSNGVDTSDLSVPVGDEFLCVDRIFSRILTEERSDLRMTVVDLEDLGILRPL